jgi:aldose 1-epimerase
MLIPLTHGPWRVDVAPDAGGSIARFDMLRGGEALPLFRPAAQHSIESADARGMGCFPLFPYSNRIEPGWMGLQPNHPAFPLAIHGEAWLRPWTVEHAEASSAILSHRHDGATGWPHAYDATQAIRLGADGLRIELTLTNRSRSTTPAGFGLHPYFHRTPATLIQANTGTVWLNDPDMLPRERVAVPAEWRLDPARPAEVLALDNCFGSWNGTAEVIWPDRRLGLRMTAAAPLGHLVVYTPAGRDYLCLEPVSHCNNGFALAERGTPDTGTIMLAPGATLSAEVAFLPRLLTE